MNLKLTYSIFGLILICSLFLSYSGGRDGNYAGAPADSGTCANCHNGGSTTGSSVSLTNVPAKFTAGQSYSLTLNLNHPSASGGGFQIVATNGVTNAMVGSFTAGSGSRLTDGSRLTQSGPRGFSSGKASWTFSWTAPTSNMPSNVVFYFAGNATNGDNDTGGDAVVASSSTTALPIELVDFNVALQGENKRVQLSWATASEFNNQSFHVERSGDDQKFSVVAEIKGQGTSSKLNRYAFTDDALNMQMNTIYYRLRQTDFDGKTSYSKTVSVSLFSKNVLKIYPTLAQKGDNLRLETSGNTAIDVIDMNGKIVKKIVSSVKSAGQNAAIETVKMETNDLQSGRYFVRSVGNNLVQTASFIVL